MAAGLSFCENPAFDNYDLAYIELKPLDLGGAWKELLAVLLNFFILFLDL
jgi:hypothetical protein